MLDFLQTIVDNIAMFGRYLGNLLEAVVKLFSFIPKALVFVTQAVGFVPSSILSFILVGVSLSLVLMIVGRN